MLATKFEMSALTGIERALENPLWRLHFFQKNSYYPFQKVCEVTVYKTPWEGTYWKARRASDYSHL